MKMKIKNTNNKQHLDFHFKADDIQENGTFKGYASVFDVEDSYGDIVLKGAFLESLNNHQKKSTMPALLWQHKRDEPIGRWTKMYEDEKGLYCEGELFIDDDAMAKRAYVHLKKGSISGLSIGFMLKDYEYDSEKGVWLLKEIDLKETSVVTFPANDEARVESVKSAFSEGGIPTKREIEQILRDAGFTRQKAKAFISDGYDGLNHRDDDDNQRSKGDDAEIIKEIEKTIGKIKNV